MEFVEFLEKVFFFKCSFIVLLIFLLKLWNIAYYKLQARETNPCKQHQVIYHIIYRYCCYYAICDFIVYIYTRLFIRALRLLSCTYVMRRINSQKTTTTKI